MKRGRGNSEIKSNQQPHVIIFRQIVSQVIENAFRKISA